MKTAKRSHRPEALERFRLGKTLAIDGQRERAVEAYLAALEIEPGFAEALVNLGILYGQMGEAHAEDALGCLKRGVELNRDSPRAHYNLGVALAKRKGHIDEAITAFEAAVALDRAHKNALYALAVQWNRKGDPVKAAAYHQWYQEAMSGKAPNPVRRAESGPAAPTRQAKVAAPSNPVLRLRFVR
jgi:tetratricopeptide (TPR) repeat protein